MADLSLLGIDEELQRVMRDELAGRASHLTGKYKPPITLRTLNCKLRTLYKPRASTLAIKAKRSREIAIKQPETGGRKKYPFAEMKVGEYFFAQNKDGHDTRQTTDSISSCAQYARRKYGFKFKTRRALNGVQVWRIA